MESWLMTRMVLSSDSATCYDLSLKEDWKRKNTAKQEEKTFCFAENHGKLTKTIYANVTDVDWFEVEI